MKFVLPHIQTILRQTPILLKTQLSDLPKTLIHSNEGTDTWSPFDIIGHLIHGEKTDWIPRIQIIMNDSENKTFEPFDRFAQFRDSKGKSIQELIMKFESLRNENLKRLDAFGLTETDLSRKGIHPSLGSVSLENVLVTWAVHDLNHIAQVNRVIASQFRENVGPWIAYLRILQ